MDLEWACQPEADEVPANLCGNFCRNFNHTHHSSIHTGGESMSRKRREIFPVVVLIMALIMVMMWLENRSQIRHEYPLSGVVQEIDERNDEVIVLDLAGNTWVFRGIEDWETGDIAAMLLRDNGTPGIYDDEILRVKYCGRVGN